ncbi:MAG: hypothetical protein J7M20_06515 [Deltaproteobacteria bacterium]|nr:hypothetical protein [Deltaproteobacteria bacterium]
MPHRLSFPFCRIRKIPVLFLTLALWFFSGACVTAGAEIFSGSLETLNDVARSRAS